MSNRILKTIALFLISFLLIFSVPALGQHHRRRHRNPEAGKKKFLKRAGVGTAIGAGAGAIIGGGRGAAIGAGVGAGAGTAYHYHKKRSYRRRHRRV